MTPATVFWELGAFAVYFVYGSFFEWFFHRYLFHAPRICYRMFKAHTLVHHQIYKGDESYHAHDGDHPEKVTMDWWALFAMVGFHLPFLILIQHFTGIPSVWGGMAAIAAYYGLYESLHWAMHVPKAARFLSRFRVYRFIDTHHRVHHKYMLSNLNVILPVADLVLGTFRDAEGRKVHPFARKTAPPTSSPACGKIPTEDKHNEGSIFPGKSGIGVPGNYHGGSRAADRRAG